MKEEECYYIDECPITLTFSMIGSKWKPIILRSLLNGERNFGQISVIIPEISKKVLVQQLKELEKSGIITRHILKENPLRVAYSLTEAGWALGPMMGEIRKWWDEVGVTLGISRSEKKAIKKGQ